MEEEKGGKRERERRRERDRDRQVVREMEKRRET